MPDARPELVSIGRVGRPHGVRGDVNVDCSADQLSVLQRGNDVFIAGTQRRIRSVRGSGTRVIVGFEGIEDRQAASQLTGCVVEAERDVLDPLEEGEYYHADLEGLRVAGSSTPEVTIGTVHRVLALPAGDALEVRGAHGGTAVLPFSREAVPEVDLGAGLVLVDVDFVREVLADLPSGDAG